MITYANTNEIDSIVKEVSLLISDLELEFNTLFKRFSNVPTVTKEWVGNQANFYFSKTNEDKTTYTAFVDQLRYLVQELNSEATNIDRQIRANNSKD